MVNRLTSSPSGSSRPCSRFYIMSIPALWQASRKFSMKSRKPGIMDSEGHNRTADRLCSNEWNRKRRILCHHAYCYRPHDGTWSSSCWDGNGNHRLDGSISYGQPHRRYTDRCYRRRESAHRRVIQSCSLLHRWCCISFCCIVLLARLRMDTKLIKKI